MFTKIRSVALAVAALGMLASAAPAQAQARAAEPAPIPERGVVQLSAGHLTPESTPEVPLIVYTPAEDRFVAIQSERPLAG